MITALELHIEVNQGFQKIASNMYDYFLPEEIDWILNKMTTRFIESCVRPRKDGSGAFEINEASADDIQYLIRTNIGITTYKDSNSRVYVVLPADYNYLLNDRSAILTDCSSLFKTTTTTKTEHVGLLKFTDSGKSSAPYYNNVTISINNTTVFNIANYKISSGLNSVNEKFVVMHLILEELAKKKISVYWERYRDLYEQDTFIIVSDTALAGSITIDTQTNLMSVTSTDYQIFTQDIEQESTNRLTKSSALPSVLNNNVFFKTIPKSPISNLGENKLFIFTSERFIVNKAILDYVRKPRKISLLLNQSSELSEGANRKICDLAVEYMKMLVESPGYQLKMGDNLLRMQ